MDDEISRAALARKGCPYLNSAQAAHYLGLSIRTMERFRKEGGGPTFRQVGWCIRYHVDHLKAWDQVQSRSVRANKEREAHQ